MKPGDHPDFYRLAPPPGASRESTIRIDQDGRFWHDGARVDHPALEKALRSWIARHPDDGRVILTNGYDWCYVKVDDAPYVVQALRVEGAIVTAMLSDESEEKLEAQALSIGTDGVVYARVKAGAFEARFSRHAQTQLEPLLTSADPPRIRIGSEERDLPARLASN